MNITSEQIQSIAVKNVEAFLNQKIPLSQAVADSAQAMQLNPEQIKRVIEATNSIAYLKLLGMSQDRTFEFPVADYNEVMKIIAVPEKMASSDVEETNCEKQEVDDQAENHDDGAMATDQNEDSEVSETDKSASLTDHEKMAALVNEYIANRAALEKIAVAREEIKLQLSDQIESLRRDSLALEKLAMVSSPETFTQLSKFIAKDGLEKSAEETMTGRVFKESELTPSRKLLDLCKRANELIIEEDRRLKLDKKAGLIMQGIVGPLSKGLGAIAGGVAGIGAGAAMKAAKGVAKGAVSIMKNPLPAAGFAFDSAASVSRTPSVDVWSSLHG